MRNFIASWLVLGFLACNSGSGDTRADNEKKDTATVGPTVSSVEAATITSAEIPASLTFKDKAVDALKWTDNAGENIFFTSYVEPYPDGDKGEGEDGRTAEIYAYHYIRKEGGDFELTWQMKDGEVSCPLDMVTEFIKGSTTVTDLDKDGLAETKVQYALACHGDVSPSSMTLILQENKTIYTLKGNRWIEYSPGMRYDVNAKNVNLEKNPSGPKDVDDYVWKMGRYESEKTFEGAPAEFLEYARNEWLKYAIQNINQ